MALIAIAAMAMAACGGDTLYSDSQHVNSDGWDMNKGLTYSVEVNDTTDNYVCYVDIRNSVKYQYSNIYFHLTTIYPKGQVAVDTNIEFQLAESDGKWKGRDNGRYVDGRYPFCLIHFPETGTYHFTIHHAMRDSLLKGINDIGIHIERQTHRQ